MAKKTDGRRSTQNTDNTAGYGSDYYYEDDATYENDYYGDDDDLYADDSYRYEYDDGYGSQDGYYEEDYSTESRREPVRGSGKNSSRGSGSSKKRRGKKKKKGANPTFVITVVLVIFLIAVFGIRFYLQHYSYSKTRADLASYFSISGDSDVPITWNNKISDVRAVLIDGGYYLSLDNVKANLNDRFYYGVQNSDDTTGMIIYCLPTQKVTVAVGSSDVSVGDSVETRDYIPAVRGDDGTVYLNLQFVQEYTDFSYTPYSDPVRLVITTDFTSSITTAEVARDTQIRTSGGIKSDILEDVSEGDQVVVLEQMDEWSEVASQDGIIGYLENKRLTGLQTTTAQDPLVYTEPEYTTHQLGEKVNMAFHNVYSTAAAEDTLINDTSNTKSINVLAPTIFWVTNEAGDISSFASQYYVDTAHSLGYKVWAVVDNINSTDLSDKSSFLHTLDARNNLISQIMTQVQTYGYDGVNVDFELIDQSYGQDYVEFIRELSIACRNAGLTCSVDNYPAYEYNNYYDITEQGVFVDYVVIMGYDEHYAGSTEAGSVASIDYVTDGIRMAVERVDKTKVINALPLYSRIWTTYNGAVSSEAYGMQDIQDYITNHGMTETWNSEAGQNYAEMTDANGALIQIWVEDNESIQLKLDAMTAADIAGVAEWKLEFDTPSVWDVIAQYMAQ